MMKEASFEKPGIPPQCSFCHTLTSMLDRDGELSTRVFQTNRRCVGVFLFPSKPRERPQGVVAFEVVMFS